MASGDSKVVDLQDLNPEFRRRMGNFLTSAKAAGLPAHIIEAYRDRAVQAQYYADKQKGLRPYPVAPPGTSFHEGGFAADTLADDRAQQQKLIDYAKAHPEFGIVPLAGDAPHFQIAGYKHLADALANPPKLGEGPSVDLSPFIAANQGYTVAKGYTPGTTVNAATAPVAGALAKPAGGGFMSSVANIESNDRNIPSGVDKDYAGQPGSKSQGHWQIDTPTWQQFGAKAGIDLTKFPNAMSAPRDIQEQVARTIPLSRFGGRTQKLLGQQYGTLDKSLTLGALDAKYGGGAPGASAAVASTGNTTPAATPPADQSIWSKLTSAPTDAEGKPVAGAKSPLQELTQASIAKLGAEGQTEQQERPAESALGGQGPGARNVSVGLGNIAQIYGQTLNSFAQPLTWGHGAQGVAGMAAGGLRPGLAAPVPGMSLSSVPAGPGGLGYGIDPNLGYGFG